MFATHPTDCELWSRVLRNDSSAFEQIVGRYQTAVSAVSYSCLGDFSASEDISQETFLVAWQSKETLENASKLKSWLCGIARNLAKNYLRRQSRQRAQVSELAVSAEPQVEESTSRAMEAEEEALVWGALESISEQYREPLVLFYREGNSVASIAETLDISQDAAKQRLSRGRNLLRDSVAQLVGRALQQTRPGKRFTAGVMAAIGTSTLTKNALAAAGVAAKASGVAKSTVVAAKAVGITGSAGLVGGAVGVLGGLGGAWLGSWVPTQLAPTIRERDLLRTAARRNLLASLFFTVGLLIGIGFCIGWVGGWKIGVPVIVASALYFSFQIIVSGLRTQRQINQLREERAEEEPNDTPLRAFADKFCLRYRGRVYRSQTELLGIPLIDVRVSDPQQHGIPLQSEAEFKTARGWIAVGDRAHGILVGIGGVARGIFAFGGRACGVVAMGGISLGLFSLGGLSLGMLSLGGGALGIWAVGGLGVGWQAVGGGAIAWDMAAGGGALAYNIAEGGGAIAQHYAVGGLAIAQEANTDLAKVQVEGTWTSATLHLLAFHPWITWVLTALCVILPIGMQRLMYERVSEHQGENANEGDATGPEKAPDTFRIED